MVIKSSHGGAMMGRSVSLRAISELSNGKLLTISWVQAGCNRLMVSGVDYPVE